MVDYGWGPVAGNAGPPVRQKTETAASVAFVLSLLGVFTWGLSCVTALFLAPRAKANINVDPLSRKGKGLVLAAQIISIWTLLIAAGITFAILGT
jgi:hypothetical protein